MQTEHVCLLLRDNDGGGRSVDTHKIFLREQARVESRQHSDATAEIKNVFRLAEVSRSPRTAFFVIFIALTIENRIDPRMRGEIIKCDFIAMISFPFSLAMKGELFKLFGRESLSLPCKIISVR